MTTDIERTQIEAAHASWDAAFNAQDANGVAELTLFHRSTHRSIGRVTIGSDDDAFSRREPVCLDDDRKPELARGKERVRILRAVTDPIAGRRNAVACHELFREHLAALELCCGARRTKDRSASLDEQIDDAPIQRKLRADDRQVDALAFGEIQHCSRIRRIDVDRRRDGAHAHVSGCANNGVDSGFCAEFPGERVLAAAGADLGENSEREDQAYQVFTRFFGKELHVRRILATPELYCPERQAHL